MFSATEKSLLKLQFVPEMNDFLADQEGVPESELTSYLKRFRRAPPHLEPYISDENN